MDAEAVPQAASLAVIRGFFEEDSTYDKMVECNYVHHQEAYAALHHYLETRCPRPFCLLDCGCGNAGYMSRTLSDLTLDRYLGIDISGVALELARHNMRAIVCRQEFECADFGGAIRSFRHQFDAVWIGLSLHHMALERKTGFFADVRSALTPHGTLLVFDPFRVEWESREEFLRRWSSVALNNWHSLTEDEMRSIQRHVIETDFPEAPSILDALAHGQGFLHGETLYVDDDEIYRLVAFQRAK